METNTQNRNDIESRSDIEKLVNTFYEKVRSDDTIGFFFSNVVAVDWSMHLPKMYDFWENVLLHTGSYKGNPMDVHFKVNGLHPINGVHFERWLLLFIQTIDELFEGETAERAKVRAKGIAWVLQQKTDSINR
ncbi:group III truncated hemoglobin [Filimonas effusa]|uniref:Group III truncated hemoglobin n=1 Tax=Filimonas effusa TaxID=2508721 RepID=A0A4Q1D5J3_9BACT|nr:group III truncated hemoglobin [Filimonas effusa]RXK83780.1 group III truncated hemoglobin [Filimonas effusa]